MNERMNSFELQDWDPAGNSMSFLDILASCVRYRLFDGPEDIEMPHHDPQ